jgi:hypothetical protein
MECRRQQQLRYQSPDDVKTDFQKHRRTGCYTFVTGQSRDLKKGSKEQGCILKTTLRLQNNYKITKIT